MAEKTAVGIVGTGWVGSSVAISTLHNAAVQEMSTPDRSMPRSSASTVTQRSVSSPVRRSGEPASGTGRDGPGTGKGRSRPRCVRRPTGSSSERGATNHAIRLVTADLLRGMLRNERRVLTVSRVQQGVFDLEDVALSLPAIVGSDGAGEVIAPELDDSERAALRHSAEVLQKAIASVAPES